MGKLSSQTVLGLVLIVPILGLQRIAAFVANSRISEHLVAKGHLTTEAAKAMLDAVPLESGAGYLLAGILAALIGGRATLVLGTVALAVAYLLLLVGPFPEVSLPLLALGNAAQYVGCLALAAAAFPLARDTGRLALVLAFYGAKNAGELAAGLFTAVLAPAGARMRIGFAAVFGVLSVVIALSTVLLIEPPAALDPPPRRRPLGVAALLGALVIYTLSEFTTELAPFLTHAKGVSVFFLVNPALVVMACAVVTVLALALLHRGQRLAPVWIAGPGLVIAGFGAAALALGFSWISVLCCAIAETAYAALTSQVMSLTRGRLAPIAIGLAEGFLAVVGYVDNRLTAEQVGSGTLTALAAIALLTGAGLLILGEAGTTVVELPPVA